MAMYNVGDQVLFYAPGQTTRERLCTVEAILLDTLRGDTEDRYRLATRVDGMRRTYTGRNRYMRIAETQTEAPPAVDAAPVPAQQIGQMIDEIFGAGEVVAANNTAGEVVPPPINEVEREAEPGGAEDALNWLNANRDRFVWGFDNPQPRRNRVQELKDAARADIQRYALGIENDLPVDFLVIRDQAIPVYDARRHGGRLTAQDYEGRTDRTMQFNFHMEGIGQLVPTYHVVGNTIKWFCPETGDYFVSQYQNNAVSHLAAGVVFDHMNVRWTRERNLQATGRIQAIPVPGMKKGLTKKKLRQKYKEMPKIREEKYYAGKEFIA